MTRQARMIMKRRAARLCIDCGDPISCPGDRCNTCRERKNELRRIRWAALTITRLESHQIEQVNRLVKPLAVVRLTQNAATR